MCNHATPDGLNVSLLAFIDVDKQPMALLGTTWSSNHCQTIIRKFTTIRADGAYNVRETTLDHDDVHDKYRFYFDTLDKHNSVRQGRACQETSWHTHKLCIRDFQML